MPLLRIVIPYAVVVVALIVLRIWTKKRYWSALLAVVLIVGVGYVGYRQFAVRTQTDPLADGMVVEVQRANIAEVVDATGNLAPDSQVTLAFSAVGRLEKILVTTGQAVRAGEVLAVLDKEDLELQLAQAQAAVDVAEANRDKLLAGARPEDITVAQSSLTQAVASRDEMNATLAASVEQARLSWIQAANALRDAQAAYEDIYWDNRELEQRLAKYDQELPEASVDAEARAWRAVENAEAAMEQARLSYEQALQRQQGSTRTTSAQVVSAQANLERLTNGPMPQDISAADAAVEQARASYEVAQAQLEKASLKAPFVGVVATILADPYNQVSAATPILILIDPASFVVDVEVDEVDISRVQVGQEAYLYLDALPDIELLAQVEEIALSPTPSQGVVTYRVRIRVTDLGDVDVRPGMTANVGIITRRASDVLIVPRRAVRIEDGQVYVERVLPGDLLESVPVDLGLEDPFFVQITAGLQEGDRVFVRGVVEQNQLQQIINDPSSVRGFQFGH